MLVPVLSVGYPEAIRLQFQSLGVVDRIGWLVRKVCPWQKTQPECLKAQRFQQAEEREEDALQFLPSIMLL